jgi:hypothetical protein
VIRLGLADTNIILLLIPLGTCIFYSFLIKLNPKLTKINDYFHVATIVLCTHEIATHEKLLISTDLLHIITAYPCRILKMISLQRASSTIDSIH